MRRIVTKGKQPDSVPSVVSARRVAWMRVPIGSFSDSADNIPFVLADPPANFSLGIFRRFDSGRVITGEAAMDITASANFTDGRA
jgi:hypothetical protein